MSKPKCNWLHLGADLKTPPRHQVCLDLRVFWAFFFYSLWFKKQFNASVDFQFPKVPLLIFGCIFIYVSVICENTSPICLCYQKKKLDQEWSPGERHLVVEWPLHTKLSIFIKKGSNCCRNSTKFYALLLHSNPATNRLQHFLQSEL